jgi:Fis family transcriptional regulator
MSEQNEIARCVSDALDGYFKNLDGEKAAGIYDMVICCVEKPLIERVLKQAGGNQTQAAELLGINRNTLRKKMKALGIEVKGEG